MFNQNDPFSNFCHKRDYNANIFDFGRFSAKAYFDMKNSFLNFPPKNDAIRQNILFEKFLEKRTFWK